MKKIKHDFFKWFADGLLRSSPNELRRTINRITKAKKWYQTKHTVVGKSLTTDVMTQYIKETSQAPRLHNIVLESFTVPQALCEEIVHATARAPLNKPTGLDLIIGESLTAASDTRGRFVVKLWRSWGRLPYIPKVWSTSNILPMFKKGDSEDPANYHPIALRSHARKFVEKAVDSMERRTYTFHPS